MKKTAIILSLLFVSVVCYRCSETTSNDNETVLEEQVSASEKVNVDVEFGIASLASSKQAVSSSKTTDLVEKAKSILISIRDAENKSIYENHKLDLVRVGDDILSLPLSFTATGTYFITLFQVLDENNVALAMTPRAGSLLSNAVTTTLDYAFNIDVDVTNRVNLEVVNIESSYGANDFGYSTFSFIEVNLVPFRVGVFSYNASTTNFELISSTITVTHLETAELIDAESHLASTVTLFTPPLEEEDVLQLTVASEGYMTRTITETYSELIKTITPQPEGNGSLIIVLEKFVTPIITATASPLIYIDANDDNSYNGIGSTWNDISGNGHNTTINGASFIEVGDLSYFNFDGVDDYLDWGRLYAVENKSNISIEMWINPMELNAVLFNNQDTSAHFSRFYSYLGQVSFSVATVDKSDRRLIAEIDSSINLNEWVHVVFVFDGTKASPSDRFDIYVDGEQEDVNYPIINDNSIFYSNVNNTWFAYSRDSRGQKYYSKVSLNLLRVYARSLTASEVQQNYDTTKSRF